MNLNLVLQSFNVIQILNEGKHSCHMSLKCKDGYGELMVYELSPALLMGFFEINARSYLVNKNRRKDILEINYCISGRSEHFLSDSSLQYLGKNDLSFNFEAHHTPEIFFPLGYVKDIGIIIDMSRREDLNKIFPAYIDIDIMKIVDRVFKQGNNVSFSVEDTMKDFYLIPKNISDKMKINWLRLKVTELLLYLSSCQFDAFVQKPIYERQLVEVIKDIHYELISDLSRRPTISELAKKYYISPTNLKNTFKGVYGSPIGKYMRFYRINTAAELLRESDENIETICHKIGYQNIGKFSDAFKSVMKKTPVNYRKTFLSNS